MMGIRKRRKDAWKEQGTLATVGMARLRGRGEDSGAKRGGGRTPARRLRRTGKRKAGRGPPSRRTKTLLRTLPPPSSAPTSSPAQSLAIHDPRTSAHSARRANRRTIPPPRSTRFQSAKGRAARARGSGRKSWRGDEGWEGRESTALRACRRFQGCQRGPSRLSLPA